MTVSKQNSRLPHPLFSSYGRALYVTRANVIFTPFTALLQMHLFINSGFKKVGGVFKVSVKQWQLISWCLLTCQTGCIFLSLNTTFCCRVIQLSLSFTVQSITTAQVSKSVNTQLFTTERNVHCMTQSEYENFGVLYRRFSIYSTHAQHIDVCYQKIMPGMWKPKPLNHELD